MFVSCQLDMTSFKHNTAPALRDELSLLVVAL